MPTNFDQNLAGWRYLKMSGLENDFVVLDLRPKGAPKLNAETVRAISNRETGVGCDQVITIEDRGGDFMGVWNADGEEVGACGNGARCVAWFLMDEKSAEEVSFATLSGDLSARRLSGLRVSVNMGRPKLHWTDIPLAEQIDDTRFVDIKLGPIDNPVLWGPSAVNMGNPHCVFFVEDAEEQALERFGPLVENHPMFPERANVSVAQVLSRHAIRLRVWERGAGLTKACGTAACASLVSAHRRRLTERKATVTLDGGDLAIEWRADDTVHMAGPVSIDGEGVLGSAIG